MRLTRPSTIGVALFAFVALAIGVAMFGMPSNHTPPALAQSETKKIKISNKNDNVMLETEGDKRRVLVAATVCLRQGQLEQLLTRKRTKEHEAILVADINAKDVHTALLLAGAEAGSPVTFLPKFLPPTGTPIKVSVEYQENGKTIRRPAQDWIRETKTKKALASNWVFAGSRLFKDPTDPDAPPYYLANDGDIICLANFDTALLDLPFDSSRDNEQLSYEANTAAIPALETAVTLILEPILEKGKKK